MEVSQIEKKLMKDLRQSSKWSKYLESIGWRSINIQGNFVFLKKIGFFSLIKIQRPENISKEFLDEVDELSRKEKGLFIKLEACDISQINALTEAGYVKSTSPLLPTKTQIISLEPKMENIKQGFSKNVSRILKKLERDESIEHFLSINPGDQEISDAYDAFEESASHKKFGLVRCKEVTLQSKIFENDSFLVISKKAGRVLAATLSYIYEDKAYFMYGGTTQEGRTLKAGHINFYETIKKLKECGYKSWDLEGIFDERFGNQQDSWLGFSHFKKMYGGYEQEFPYPYTKTTSDTIKKIEQKMGRIPF